VAKKTNLAYGKPATKYLQEELDWLFYLAPDSLKYSQETFQLFEEYIHQSPKPLKAYIPTLYFMLRLDNNEIQAAQALNLKYAELCKNNPYFQLYHAILLKKQGFFAQAVPLFQALIKATLEKLDKDNPEGWTYLINRRHDAFYEYMDLLSTPAYLENHNQEQVILEILKTSEQLKNRMLELELTSQNATDDLKLFAEENPISSTRQNLSDKSILLYYIVLNQRLLLFTITSTSISLYQKEIAYQDWHEKIIQFKELISLKTNLIANNCAVPIDDIKSWQEFSHYENMLECSVSRINQRLQIQQKYESELSAPFYSLLFAMAEDEIRAHLHLIIIPNNFLVSFPFHALLNKTPRKRKWMLQDQVMSYLPSLSLLPYLKHASIKPRAKIALVQHGDLSENDYLLDATRRTLETLFHDYGHSSITIILHPHSISSCNYKESLLDFLKLHNDVEILIFLGHSQFKKNEDHNFLSALQLAEGQLLTHEEIEQHLKFKNHPLILMLSCQSGLANIQDYSDEFFGLNRAFIQAGASGFLATLWKVANIPITFNIALRCITNLFENKRMPEALNASISEFLNQQQIYGIDHPYLWAGFYYMGV
jgi:CHAT domain-containing protein